MGCVNIGAMGVDVPHRLLIRAALATSGGVAQRLEAGRVAAQHAPSAVPAIATELGRQAAQRVPDNSGYVAGTTAATKAVARDFRILLYKGTGDVLRRVDPWR